MNESTPPPADLRCERVGLLLSLRLDGEATPAQVAEIDAHVAECADCAAAAAADEAVRARLAELAVVPAGFADRVLDATARMRAEARTQNRMLIGAAAAAVFVAIASVASFVPAAGNGVPNGSQNGEMTASARGRTVEALTTATARFRVEER